jgi:hypothetical protein
MRLSKKFVLKSKLILFIATFFFGVVVLVQASTIQKQAFEGQEISQRFIARQILFLWETLNDNKY